MRRVVAAFVLLIAACGGRPRPAAEAPRLPRVPRPLERFVPHGADVVIGLDLAALRAAWGKVDLAGAGAQAGVELARLRAVEDMDEAVLAVWSAGTETRRELVIARGAGGGAQLWVEGDPALMAEAERLIAAPGIAPADPRLAVSTLASVDSSERIGIRVRMAGTTPIREALLPLLGSATLDLEAALVEVRVAPAGGRGRAVDGRAVLRTASEDGADFLATHIRDRRAALLASGAVARLGLDRFVAPLTADADGVRARAAFSLSHDEVRDLRAKLELYGELLSQLRARAATPAEDVP